MSWGGDWFESLNKGLKSVETLMENVDKTASASLKKDKDDHDEDIISEDIDSAEPTKSYGDDSDMFGFLGNSKDLKKVTSNKATGSIEKSTDAEKPKASFDDMWDDFSEAKLANTKPKSPTTPQHEISKIIEAPSLPEINEASTLKKSSVAAKTSWDFDDFDAIQSEQVPNSIEVKEKADLEGKENEKVEFEENEKNDVAHENEIEIITGESPTKESDFTVFEVPELPNQEDFEDDSRNENDEVNSTEKDSLLEPNDSQNDIIAEVTQQNAESPKDGNENDGSGSDFISESNQKDNPILPMEEMKPTERERELEEELNSVKSVFSEKISDLSSENEKLRTEVIRLNGELKEISKKFNSVQKELKMSERELEIAREGLNRHQVLFERSKGEIEQQHIATIRNQETKIKEMVSKIAEFELQVTQAKVKYDSVLSKLSATESELKTVTNECDQNQELAKMLRVQIDQLTTESLNHRQELDDVKRAHFTEMRELEERIRSLAHELQSEKEAGRIASTKAQHLIAIKEAEISASRLASPQSKPLSSSSAILAESDLNDIDFVSVNQYQVLLKENKRLQSQLRSLESELQIAKAEISEIQLKWDGDKELLAAELAAEQSSKKSALLESQVAIQQMRVRLESSQHDLVESRERLAKAHSDSDALRAEVAGFRRSRTSLSESGGLSGDEGSRRLSELTEHLMSKQRHIEVIESERSALQLRVETLVKEIQNYKAAEAESTIIDMGIVDNEFRKRTNAERIKQTSMSSLISSWQPHEGVQLEIQKNTAKALEGIDYLTARLGYYLRSSPAFRLFVFIYFIFVHLFLMYILAQWSHDMGSKAPHERSVKEMITEANKVNSESKA